MGAPHRCYAGTHEATRWSAMTLGNMRELGVQRLIASCLNDACRHTALIDVSS